MVYNIFNNSIKINIENEEIRDILKQELDIYPKGEKNNIDIIVNFVDKVNVDNIYSNTPSIHKTFENGFLASFGANKILFKKEDKIEVYIEISNKKRFLVKFLSIGYRYNYENVGQILHELIFVPINFFTPNTALIHASSMKKQSNNKTIMIGGTGGVGKTSLELLLCKELNYSFISDDIAVVTNENKIYPNLSYPKLYAYNVVNNKKLSKELFMGRNCFDKFQWNFIKRYRGDKRVRRAVSPDKIYRNIEKNTNSVDEYYILFKTNSVEDIVFEDIDYKQASELTLRIIKNEYQSFAQHITWHEYNTQLMNFSPILELEKIYSNWSEVYMNIFKLIKCSIVKIPIEMEHDDFLEQMKDKFK